LGRLVNVLFALILIAALVLVFSPQARQQAAEAVEDLEPTLRQLDERVIVNIPSVDVSDHVSTPVPSPTPFATPLVEEDEDVVGIPVTGEEDSSDEPFIVINWDAIGDALRNFWERLRTVEIDLTPDDTP
jgi:hypothetical protein